MLNHLRYGQLVSGDIYSYDLIGMVEPISPKYLKDNVEEFMNTTFLTPSNEKAKEINNLIFNRIKAEAVSFDSNNLDYKGKVPAPKKVTVKKGQKVMITKNIYKEKELYLQNGTIGFVHKIRRGKWVKVRIPSRGDEIVKIERVSWTNKKSFPEKFKSKNGKEYSKVRKEVIGEYQQLPLKSAYAMTIHKSQGLTLDKVHVFNEKLFAPSQLYVALSRVKSINDVTLQVDIKNGQKMIKPEVYDFYKTHNLFPKELTSN